MHSLFDTNYGGIAAPVDLVQFLLKVNPNAILSLSRPTANSFDSEGTLPLHMACKKGESKANLKILIEAYPEALQSKHGRDQNYPLHELCNGGCKNLDVMHYIVQQFPEALQRRNKLGMLPIVLAIKNSGMKIFEYLLAQYPFSVHVPDCLFEACKCGNLEVIQYFCNINKPAAAMADQDGKLALHLACSHHQNLEVWERTLSMYPPATNIQDHEGNLPLHLACGLGVREKALRWIVDQSPEAAKVKNIDGMQPLHILCSTGEYWKRKSYHIMLLLEAYPYAVKETDIEGRIPLHLACFQSFSLTDVKFLIQQFPASIKCLSPKYGLPIHAAALGNINLESVKYLAGLSKDLLNVNVAGLGLPLHCAIMNDQKDKFDYLLTTRFPKSKGSYLHSIFKDVDLTNKTKVAGYLLEAHPESMYDIDAQGASPLHWAVTSTVGVEYIEDLIRKDKNALYMKDKSNSLPLHYALRHRDPSRVANLLLDLNVEAVDAVVKDESLPLHAATKADMVRSADNNGSLPLHVACRYGAPLPIVKRLFQLYEESATIKDNQGELALHKACRGGHLALVTFLMEKDISSVRVPNIDGVFPALALCQASGKNRLPFDKKVYIGTIWQLLRACPEAILKRPSTKKINRKRKRKKGGS